jgi:hypothetical protein
MAAVAPAAVLLTVFGAVAGVFQIYFTYFPSQTPVALAVGTAVCLLTSAMA